LKANPKYTVLELNYSQHQPDFVSLLEKLSLWLNQLKVFN